MTAEESIPLESAENDIPIESTGGDSQTVAEFPLPPDLLEAIPEEKREEFSRKFGEFFLEVRREEHYSGPLQPSQEAERWDALVPGSAERNFNLYEEQQLKRMEAQDRILAITDTLAQHRTESESKQHQDNVAITTTELKNSADEVKRGQIFAFVVVIGITIGGFTMIHLGHDGGGIASLLVAAASVAGIFVSQLTRGRNTYSSKASTQESTLSDSQH